MKAYIGVVDSNWGHIWSQDNDGLFRCPAIPLMTLEESRVREGVKNGYLAPYDEWAQKGNSYDAQLKSLKDKMCTLLENERTRLLDSEDMPVQKVRDTEKAIRMIRKAVYIATL